MFRIHFEDEFGQGAYDVEKLMKMHEKKLKNLENWVVIAIFGLKI